MKENEIRPPAIFNEFLRLTVKDIETFFLNVKSFAVNCPACGAVGTPLFVKHGFGYDSCPQCRTLYVNPRPERNAFIRYYTQGESTEYWATTFYRETAVARRDKIWKPKAKQILTLMQKYKVMDRRVYDIGGGYGLFADEFGRLSEHQAVVIEPNSHLATACREKNILVIEDFLEDITPADLCEDKKVFVSFELFEHLYEPKEFLNTLINLMREDDMFVFSTLSGQGLDILALGKDANAISPPQHLNFLNPRSIEILLEQCGFEMLEVTTPGQLDVDILSNNKEQIKDGFWRAFVESASEQSKKEMQDVISSSGWSSHMLVVCKKAKVL